MKYEYKSISLTDDDCDLGHESETNLNNWLDLGWEYVDKIVQTVSTGGYSKRGSVMVILRKAKTEKDLLP